MRAVALVMMGAVLALGSGCTKDETEATGIAAEVAITSPAAGDTVTAEAEVVDGEPELEVELEFTVTGFTLREPGACAGAEACGHVHIHVDGETCNDVEEDGTVHDFNEEVFASPAGADLIYCEGVTVNAQGVMGADGPHVIKLTLHGDDEALLNNLSGVPIEDEVDVTVEVQQ